MSGIWFGNPFKIKIIKLNQYDFKLYNYVKDNLINKGTQDSAFIFNDNGFVV